MKNPYSSKIFMRSRQMTDSGYFLEFVKTTIICKNIN